MINKHQQKQPKKEKTIKQSKVNLLFQAISTLMHLIHSPLDFPKIFTSKNIQK